MEAPAGSADSAPKLFGVRSLVRERGLSRPKSREPELLDPQKTHGKKIVGFIKLQAGRQGQPVAPIGPALGQRGLNIMEFCKAFNAQTQGCRARPALPVVITALRTRASPSSSRRRPATLIKKAIKLDKGSRPDRQGRQDHRASSEIARPR